MILGEICTYEVCKLARDKGFDWDCPMFYTPEGKLRYGWAYDPMNSGLDMRDMLCHNSKLPIGFAAECTAPSQSLLQRWLREEKWIIIELKYSDDTESFRPFWSWQIYNTLGITLEIGEPNTTYELALEDALKYALENLV